MIFTVGDSFSTYCILLGKKKVNLAMVGNLGMLISNFVEPTKWNSPKWSMQKSARQSYVVEERII